MFIMFKMSRMFLSVKQMSKVITHLSRTFAAFFILVLSFSAGQAQVSTGQISGTIRDANGAVLAGAAVIVLDQQTLQERRVTSDKDGFYLMTNLSPSSYRVRIELSGFKSFRQDSIRLNAGDRLNVSPSLQIGEVTEVVTISAMVRRLILTAALLVN
jgi:Carboxypeptidase regulatory-like domain